MCRFNYIKLNEDIPDLPIVDLYLMNYDDPKLSYSSNFAFLDTGSDVTFVSFSIISKIKPTPIKVRKNINGESSIRTIDANLPKAPYFLKVGFDGRSFIKTRVFALPDETMSKFNCEILVGRNVLKHYVVTFDGRQSISIVH